MNHAFKIEELLSTAAKLGFTKHDFADLAIVAARRSGATAAEQTLVTTALGIEAQERDRGTKHDHVSALARVCRQLGGRLAIVSQRTLSDLFNRDWPDEGDEDSFDLEHHEGFSPNNEDDMQHGLNWRRGSSTLCAGAKSGLYHPRNGARVCRSLPARQLQVSRAALVRLGNSGRPPISAWETWSRHNARRSVGGAEWGELPMKRRQAVIANRVRYAKRIGVLSETGEPRSVR